MMATPGPDPTPAQTTATTTGAVTRSEAYVVTQEKPWYNNLNPFRWGEIPPVPEQRTVSREYNASFFSQLCFQWMFPIMSLGYKRPIEENDIWLVNPNRSVKLMSQKVQESFTRRLARGDRYPLLWALHETLYFEFWIGGICALFSQVLEVVAPFTLRYLISFVSETYKTQKEGTPAPSIGKGLGLVFGITIMQLCQSLGTNHSIYRGYLMGAQSRAILISILFEKSMVISGRAKAGGEVINDAADGEKIQNDQSKNNSKRNPKKGEENVFPKSAPGISGDGTGWSNSKIINLMSIDTSRIDHASGMFHLGWTTPLACTVTLVLLVINLTYSALVGFALLLFGFPLLTMAVKSLFVRRRAINKVTDQRVSLTQEILQTVRFIKYFGWESAFLKRLEDIRHREIRAIQILLAIRNAINAFSISLPIFASILAFVTYSFTHTDLNPALVFSSLALFNSLRLPLNMLPMVIGQLTDAWLSFQRIEEFLQSEEQHETAAFNLDISNAVQFENAGFTWERNAIPRDNSGPPVKKDPDAATKAVKKAGTNALKEQIAAEVKKPDESSAGTPDNASMLVKAGQPFKLHNINFSIGRNELVAVIGGVGSGKSSLLAALASDMRKTQGNVTFGANRAFCPQYAWIENATVQENILFGKEMDKKWYNQVVDACALQLDFDMLPNGDQTEIGERGITLSGGQKQRLNIARAIYFNASLILMDDPLSAVDAHVGRHIFDNAIVGLLKDKARILATHQSWILSRCDRIILLDNSTIQAIDTFPNLMENHAGFQQLMNTTAIEQKQEESEGVDDAPSEEKKSNMKETKKAPGLMQTEERAVKSVPYSVYLDYVRASGSIFAAPLVMTLLVASQGANISTTIWLSWWTSNKWGYNTSTYIGVYAGLGSVQATITFCFAISLTILGTTASKTMLSRAMKQVLRAPVSFFDTTPIGRITNRFSHDVDVMDNNLTDAIRVYFLTVAQIFAVFILIIAYFYYFIIALVPLLGMFIFAAAYYRASAREIKRFESIFRSLVFSKFSEGISGTACIRAYGLKDRFILNLRESIDQMNSAYFLTFANQCWLAMRLDIIGNLLVFTTGILVVTSRFHISPSIAGLVLSYIISIVQIMQFSIRQLAEVENGMNATERLNYYGTQLEEEAPLHITEVRKSWPESGNIVFKNVQMRYRANLPLVLNNLSMSIKGGERIGIVGRTGAGKSSIISTLFRLVELSGGLIAIDGVDISTIGLHDLRSRLAIIPQDPTLFKGTIRSNLDPFNQYTDLELWSALRQVNLVSEDARKDSTSPGRIHLDGIVEDEGLNFSLGQRQLIALARALIRGSQILVCDEATSSVDMETDERIQRTIVSSFKGKTLLCVAHRLNTIINYDRICVIDHGTIVELGMPLELYTQGGIFRSMCDKGGIRREDFIGYDKEA